MEKYIQEANNIVKLRIRGQIMETLKIDKEIAAERSVRFIDDTVSSITKRIIDDPDFQKMRAVIFQAATQATIREELDRLVNRVTTIAKEEAENIGQQFAQMIANAAVEAIKETFDELLKSK